MKTIRCTPDDDRYLPFAKVSRRATLWAMLTGMAIALPGIYLVRLTGPGMNATRKLLLAR